MVLNKFLIFILLLLTACFNDRLFALNNLYCSAGKTPVQLLGNDTLICGQSYWDIQAAGGYDFYHWSTGECTQSVTLHNTGNYKVISGFLGPNLIKNNGFENGNTEYLTEYSFTAESKFNSGQFSIAQEPLKSKKYQECSESSGIGGNVMAIKRKNEENALVWGQEITTRKNTDYLFTCWISNGTRDKSDDLEIFINDVIIEKKEFIIDFNCSWKKISAFWNSGKVKTCKIEIRSSLSGESLFLLDNIGFSTVKTVSDEINITIDPIHVNAGPDLTSCTNDPEVITALCNDPNAKFTWNTGNNEMSITPQETGIYSISATSVNGCKVFDSVYVEIIDVNWSISRVYATPTYCSGSYGTVNVETEGDFDDFPYYTWSGPGAFSSSDISSPVWRNLDEGLYFVTIRSGSCFHFDSVYVSNEDGPEASFTYKIGDNSKEVHFVNSSKNGNLFIWDFGNGEKMTSHASGELKIQYKKPGIYTVRLTVTRPGCNDDVHIQKIRIE